MTDGKIISVKRVDKEGNSIHKIVEDEKLKVGNKVKILKRKFGFKDIGIVKRIDNTEESALGKVKQFVVELVDGDGIHYNCQFDREELEKIPEEGNEVPDPESLLEAIKQPCNIPFNPEAEKSDIVAETDIGKRLGVVINTLNFAKEQIGFTNYEDAFNNITRCSRELQRIIEVMNRKPKRKSNKLF